MVQEIYKDYTPEVNVRKIIQILLEYVPPEDLAHLQSIVLTNTAALSRKRKRQRGASGAPISRVLGRCQQRWKGQLANIEIFVDNILSDASWYDLRIPMLRNGMFANVLYHEIGHHVQVISNSQLVKEEAFADKYARRLKKRFVRQRYGHYRPLWKSFYWFIKKVGLVKFIERRSGEIREEA
ncbi:hypothetical protein [uncultured Nitrospira sp.]|uniref:hypothetical protein n=1 Tax=uncultured Nitrospira sp. TaxID=157176 RepID=UPI0031402D30